MGLYPDNSIIFSACSRLQRSPRLRRSGGLQRVEVCQARTRILVPPRLSATAEGQGAAEAGASLQSGFRALLGVHATPAGTAGPPAAAHTCVSRPMHHQRAQGRRRRPGGYGSTASSSSLKVRRAPTRPAETAPGRPEIHIVRRTRFSCFVLCRRLRPRRDLYSSMVLANLHSL